MKPSESTSERSDPLLHAQRRARRPSGADRPLRRARSGRQLGGVCAGIAAFVNASPQAVRAIWLVSLLPSLGVTAVAYPVAWWLIPLEPPPTAAL
jgi:phage shock protein C